MCICLCFDTHTPISTSREVLHFIKIASRQEVDLPRGSGSEVGLEHDTLEASSGCLSDDTVSLTLLFRKRASFIHSSVHSFTDSATICQGPAVCRRRFWAPRLPVSPIPVSNMPSPIMKASPWHAIPWNFCTKVCITFGSLNKM